MHDPGTDAKTARDGGPTRRRRRRALVAAAAMTVMLGVGAASAAAQGVGQIGLGTSPLLEVEGVAEADDYLGLTGLATGDFNGDGYDDTAVGVPLEDVDGVSDAGAVNVIYGSTDGLSATKVRDQLWHQDVDGLEHDAEVNDHFGADVAAGDFDGDGYDDLAVSVPYEEVNGTAVAGAVQVIHGSGDGLNVQEVPVELLHQDVPGVPDEAEQHDRFGGALAVGRFNDDDYDDLAVGVPWEDVDGVEDAGAVNLFYGTRDGLLSPAGLPGLTRLPRLWHQNVAGVQSDPAQGEEFGSSLATGNFDGDHFDDLAIGVPQDVRGGVPEAGAVSVLHGSTGGLLARGSDSEFWHQDSSGVDDEAEFRDLFGHALAAGDFDGDGYGDLAVGVYNESVGALTMGGAVSVIHGSASGLSATATPDQLWHQDVADVDGERRSNEHFGGDLAVGGFNADGYDDLAVGVHLDIVGGVGIAGSVNVIHGSRHGLNATHVPDQLWNQGSDGVAGDLEFGDVFGSTVAVGRFNGDGYDDIVIGSPYEDVGTTREAGALNVIHGSEAGLSTSPIDGQFWHQDS